MVAIDESAGLPNACCRPFSPGGRRERELILRTTGEDVQVVSQTFYEAVAQVMHADATAMLTLWSEHNDVTYCDPYGQVHCGREALVDYWQQAASRNSQAPGSVSATAELLMVQQSDEMVCMVLREHIQVRQQDRVTRLHALATNIYRYEEQHWRMIHRHAGTLSEEN